MYGQSFESLKTEHILGLVSQLRPDMVKELKTNGSGKLPKDIQRRKTEHFTASANDAFATIRITARDSTEECYCLLYTSDLHIRSGARPVQYRDCSAWCGCAAYLFPAEWCDFAGYGIFD